MDEQFLDEEVPVLSDEALRFNRCVLGIRRVVSTIENYDKGLADKAATLKALVDGAHETFEALLDARAATFRDLFVEETEKFRGAFKSFHSLFSGHRTLLEQLDKSIVEARGKDEARTAKSDDVLEAISLLLANLPDRERMAESAGRTAANDVYMQLQYEVFGWFQRVEATPELGGAILTVRDAVVEALKREEAKHSATAWQKFKMRCMDLRGRYQRFQRAFYFPVTTILIVIVIGLQLYIIFYAK